MPSSAPLRQLLALALCTALPFAALAEPVRFDGYEAFYRSLGGNLFEGAGSALSLACTEAQQCLWVNAMAAAVKRYDSEQWSAPGTLEGEPPAGMPEIAFDGQRLDIGKRHWSLAAVTDLAPTDWQAGASIDPEGLYSLTAWRNGESFCLELPAKGSGRADRYTQVLLVQGQTLYNLPPLFASCAAVREAPQGSVLYPSNAYLEETVDNEPAGLRVDYLQPGSKTPAEQHRLRFPDPRNPFIFEIR